MDMLIDRHKPLLEVAATMALGGSPKSQHFSRWFPLSVTLLHAFAYVNCRSGNFFKPSVLCLCSPPLLCLGDAQFDQPARVATTNRHASGAKTWPCHIMGLFSYDLMAKRTQLQVWIVSPNPDNSFWLFFYDTGALISNGVTLVPLWTCEQCGAQFPESDAPPASCPICEDERQYVNWKGQPGSPVRSWRSVTSWSGATISACSELASSRSLRSGNAHCWCGRRMAA